MQQKEAKQQITETTEPTQRQSNSGGYVQYSYRWVVVALVGFAMVVNGLGNNNVIPIASKLAKVYDLSTVYVNSPVTTSFLVYSIMNFPANYFMDKRGVRASFLVGMLFYSLGLLLFVFVNTSYVFALIGAILIATGQPFIINSPAKVATLWFSSQNRPLATGIMTASNLVGTLIGFVVPTLFVFEDSVGDQAKTQIFHLYGIEAILGVVGFLLIIILMRAKPPTAPSAGAQKDKTSLKQSFLIIKKDRNLWVFIAAYIVVYGTLLSFGSNANLLFKPYGFTDIVIAMMALCLILFGVLGSLAFTFFIKKTNKYQLCIRLIPFLALIFMAITSIFLNVLPLIPIIFICTACIGFFFTPLVPICYDLGCQLAFPMGQAQMIGILNGGSMIYTFLFNLILGSAVGLQSKQDSLILMIVFAVFLLAGGILFCFVKVILKRKMHQSGQSSQQQSNKQENGIQLPAQSRDTPIDPEFSTQIENKQQKRNLIERKKYDDLIEEAI